MDDLVKRLRRYGEWIREDRDPSLFTLVTDEAADRIEQLEAALRKIAELSDKRSPHGFANEFEYYEMAHAALGEKKDG